MGFGFLNALFNHIRPEVADLDAAEALSLSMKSTLGEKEKQSCDQKVAEFGKDGPQSAMLELKVEKFIRAETAS